jgi:hypothetical protein
MRGTPGGETPVSQAATDEYRESHDRVFGERKPGQRGRWIWDASVGRLVRADEYVPPDRAVDAPIIADRVHEGTFIDTGNGMRDVGSRAKRRQYQRETGLAEASDYGPGWRERKASERERLLDRRTSEAVEQAKRTMYRQGKLR